MYSWCWLLPVTVCCCDSEYLLFEVMRHRCCCCFSTVIHLTLHLLGKVRTSMRSSRVFTQHRRPARHCIAWWPWRDHTLCRPLDCPTPGLLYYIRWCYWACLWFNVSHPFITYIISLRSAAKVLRRPCGRLIPSISPSLLSFPSLGYPFPPAFPFFPFLSPFL